MTIKSQNDEFTALDALSTALQLHDATPVVDDDYPRIRHQYEAALTAFIEAMKQNERFRGGNRYGLVQS